MIEVVVGSNVSQATAGIEKFKNSLNTLPAAMTPLSGGIQILNTQLERLQRIASLPGLSFQKMERLQGMISSVRGQLSRFETAGKGFETSFQRIGGAATQANFALLNTGRVIQDLPFGFLGIANNLNPLLESFQRLKAESGSSRIALQQLGKSFLGAGGLGLALSLASTAMLLFTNGLQSFSKKSREAKEDVDRLAEVLKSIGSAAGKVEIIAAGTTEETSKVIALSNAVLDQTKSYAQRNNAINQLKEINKSYFGDLTLESDKLSALRGKVEEYTQAIIAAATVRAFSEDIGKLNVEFAKQLQVFNKAGNALDGYKRKLGETRESETSLTGEDRVSRAYVKAKKDVDGATSAYKKQIGVLDEIRGKMGEFKVALTDAVNESLKFDPLKEIKQAKTETLDQFMDKIIARARQFTSEFGEAFVVPDLSDSFLKTKDQIFKASKQLLEDVKNLNLKVRVPVDIGFDFVPAEVGPPLARLGKDLEEAMRGITGIQLEPFVFDPSIIIAIQDEKAKEEVKKIMEDFSKSINQSIKEARENIATEGLATIGESIGAALSGGDLKGVFSNFANTIAEGLQAIGKQIIKIGVVALLAKEALKKLFANPALAIAAGIALVAAGAALKGALSGGIKQRAKGGPVNPNEPFLVGEKGPELFYPRSYGTIIPNNSLNNSVAASLGNRPQVQTVMVIGEIQGDVIRLTQARSQKRAGRSYG